MGYEKKARIRNMAIQANQRFNAEVTLIRPKVLEDGAIKNELVVKLFENVETPGANQIGFMLFIGDKQIHHIPLQQIIGMKLILVERALVEVPRISSVHSGAPSAGVRRD